MSLLQSACLNGAMSVHGFPTTMKNFTSPPCDLLITPRYSLSSLMDKVLVKQLAQIRKQLNASALREAINSSCSPQVGPLLIAQLGGVIANESVVAQIIPSSLKKGYIKEGLGQGIY